VVGGYAGGQRTVLVLTSEPRSGRDDDESFHAGAFEDGWLGVLPTQWSTARCQGGRRGT
jgi:hypothetical protein